MSAPFDIIILWPDLSYLSTGAQTRTQSTHTIHTKQQFLIKMQLINIAYKIKSTKKRRNTTTVWHVAH